VPTTTREHILDAAARVLQTRGLGGATTREIAQAAGLSEAALYKHFQDKEQLYLCTLKERFPQLAAALHDLPTRVGRRTVRKNLEELATVALAFYDHGAPVAASLFADPALLARHREAMRQSGGGPQKPMEHLTAYLRAEQRLGRVARGARVEAAAGLLLGACLQRALLRQFLGDPVDPEADARFVRDSVRTVLAGIGAPPQPRRPRASTR
jgi:AcrR family transcriptional regulator